LSFPGEKKKVKKKVRGLKKSFAEIKRLEKYNRSLVPDLPRIKLITQLVKDTQNVSKFCTILLLVINPTLISMQKWENSREMKISLH
jgi:hypothetical protein